MRRQEFLQDKRKERVRVQVAVLLDSAGKIPRFVKVEVLEDVGGESIGAFAERVGGADRLVQLVLRGAMRAVRTQA